MSEVVLDKVKEEVEVKEIEPKNPFLEDNWVESPAEKKEPVIEEKKEIIEEKKMEEKSEAAIDANEWLKQNFGWENEELGKKEVEELRKMKEENEKTPKLKLADAIKEKEEDLYNYFAAKKSLERAEKLDLTKTSDAKELVKLNLQHKHKDLTSDEIDYLFDERFSIPSKPEQGFEETDEDYQKNVAKWEKQVDSVQKRLIIEAKLVKPEIATYKSQLVAPDINIASDPVNKEPTPEELEGLVKAKESYLQQVSKGLKDLKGFNATYKDEEVEIPISYEITKEEKAALKPVIESLYASWDYFGKRWANADGSFNTELMAEDLYLLENKGNVFQKFANEAGTKRYLHALKAKVNVDLENTPKGTFKPEAKQIQEKQVEAIMMNG